MFSYNTTTNRGVGLKKEKPTKLLLSALISLVDGKFTSVNDSSIKDCWFALLESSPAELTVANSASDPPSHSNKSSITAF